jgi:hypothetical protein
MKIIYTIPTFSEASVITEAMALVAQDDDSVDYTCDGVHHTYTTRDGRYVVDWLELTLTFTGQRSVFGKGCAFGVCQGDGQFGHGIRLFGISAVIPLKMVYLDTSY